MICVTIVSLFWGKGFRSGQFWCKSASLLSHPHPSLSLTAPIPLSTLFELSTILQSISTPYFICFSSHIPFPIPSCATYLLHRPHWYTCLSWYRYGSRCVLFTNIPNTAAHTNIFAFHSMLFRRSLRLPPPSASAAHNNIEAHHAVPTSLPSKQLAASATHINISLTQ